MYYYTPIYICIVEEGQVIGFYSVRVEYQGVRRTPSALLGLFDLREMNKTKLKLESKEKVHISVALQTI